MTRRRQTLGGILESGPSPERGDNVLEYSVLCRYVLSLSRGGKVSTEYLDLSVVRG